MTKQRKRLTTNRKKNGEIVFFLRFRHFLIGINPGEYALIQTVEQNERGPEFGVGEYFFFFALNFYFIVAHIVLSLF